MIVGGNAQGLVGSAIGQHLQNNLANLIRIVKHDFQSFKNLIVDFRENPKGQCVDSKFET